LYCVYEFSDGTDLFTIEYSEYLNDRCVFVQRLSHDRDIQTPDASTSQFEYR